MSFFDTINLMVAEDHRSQDEQSTRKRANLLGVRYFDTRALKTLPLFKDIFTTEEMYKYHSIILSLEKGRMIIAITVNTPQPSLADFKERFKDYRLSFVMISESGFNDFMAEYDPPEKVEYEDINIKPNEAAQNVQDVSKTLETVRADDIFNYLTRQANYLNASDIHLETQEGRVIIRFRVDGVMHQIAEMSYEKYRQLSSTIAIHANISTSAPMPQTGHMNHKITDDEGQTVATVNMRIETVPTLFGQDAVVRIFNIEKDLLQLENLGLSDDERNIIDDIVANPSGLVLSVGPTGSGKTTTLYSILNKLNSTERKLITLEDPVEYTLPGVVQIPVDTSHEDSFAEKLRAVLRLDPDVIMVGEIRDADTAKTALQAALSGHLVLSTFHAADTTAALSRLSEFLGDNPLFTSAIRLIVAQRLVRTLDQDSKQEIQLDEHLWSRFEQEISTFPEDKRPNIADIKFYGPTATDNSPFGYSGQTAVVELLQMSPDIEKLLHSESLTTAIQIRKTAVKNGMRTLLQDALLKVIDGETSAEEVFRVVS